MMTEHNIANMREDTQDLTPDDWRQYRDYILKYVAYRQEAFSERFFAAVAFCSHGHGVCS